MELISSLPAGSQLGLLGLISFFASTILPVGSEWLVAMLVAKGHEISTVVIVATFGNTLGSVTTYLLGTWGMDRIAVKWQNISPRRMQQARRFYARYGVWSLLLSWLPVIGDAFCLMAGIFRAHLISFLLLVVLGKGIRYATLAIIVMQASGKQ